VLQIYPYIFVLLRFSATDCGKWSGCTATGADDEASLYAHGLPPWWLKVTSSKSLRVLAPACFESSG